MAERSRYTENEIILCTYIARFGRGFINEELVRSLFDRRPLGSVRMKVQNIARMLSEEGYGHSREVSPWGGGHRSNWHTVQRYASWPEPAFAALVKKLLARGRSQTAAPLKLSQPEHDIDGEACATIMRRYRLGSRQEAINLALRTLAAAGPQSVTAVRQLRGSGRANDLEEMRGRTS